jgi:hypothetical protein
MNDLSHGVAHALSPDDVQMQVEDNLVGVRSGVDDRR